MGSSGGFDSKRLEQLFGCLEGPVDLVLQWFLFVSLVRPLE